MEEAKKEEHKTEKKKENISMIVFIILGFVAGYLSFLLNDVYYSIIAMVAILLLSQKIIGIVLKVKEKMRWWMKNGGFIYIFLWIIFWIVLYNL